jgi:coenzyme F420 hydrogenase subunit delta
MMHESGQPPWAAARGLILGCGNPLLGDDGFGPAVARHIEAHLATPAGVVVVDAGTAVRKILLDLLIGDRPERLVIVDAIDRSRQPGDIFEVPLDDLSYLRSDDFSTHLGPVSSLLFDLRDGRGMDVRILACQVAGTSDVLGEPMSERVRAAVPLAAAAALRLVA